MESYQNTVRNPDRSLTVIQGCPVATDMSSIRCGGRQQHTPQCTTPYGILNTIRGKGNGCCPQIRNAYKIFEPIRCLSCNGVFGANSKTEDISSDLQETCLSCPITEHRHKLECGTWYHHRRRLQCGWSRNLRIFKVTTWHYWCRHNLENDCIWDNLQCCLFVPRSASKPSMLTFDLQSEKAQFIEIVFWHA